MTYNRNRLWIIEPRSNNEEGIKKMITTAYDDDQADVVILDHISDIEKAGLYFYFFIRYKTDFKIFEYLSADR